VAAGPVGRSTKAATDLKFDAKILAYSRAKGLFAGATLNGTALQADEESNEKFYGKRLNTRAIVLDNQVTGNVPAVANEWREMLKRHEHDKADPVASGWKDRKDGKTGPIFPIHPIFLISPSVTVAFPAGVVNDDTREGCHR